MLEKAIKFLFKILLMFFTLLGIRHVLLLVGIKIPFEWFVIMIAGMFGFYGIIIVVIYATIINFL